MTYFDRSERPATAANTHQRVGAPVVVRRRPDDAQDQRDAAPGEHRAGRPHERPGLAERERDLDDRAGEDRREDLRHAHLEAQADLAEDVDRDDDRRDVQPRIARVRQDERVAVPPRVSVRAVTVATANALNVESRSGSLSGPCPQPGTEVTRWSL